MTGQARADERSPDGVWTVMDIMPKAVQDEQPWERPAVFKALKIDPDMLKAQLAMAPMEHTPGQPVRMTLPRPDGGFESFDIVEYSMMEPGLAAAFPEIKTYYGQCVDEPAANVYLDWTPLGFHAQVLSPTGGHAIDPYSRDNTTYYSAYFFKDLRRAEGFQCLTPPDFVPENPYAGRATGGTLRTYRLAMAAVATFTSYYGGASQAQAGIVTGVNRINQVYGNEFAIRFTLVANNQNLMYTDGASQPYTDGDLSTMLGQNQTNINSVIGSANYDVGHVVSGMNLGGLAQLRAVCSTSKARGATGLSSPTSDFFWVQYVSHELGHEFGANHSFNADDSADGNVCLPNRNGPTAYEPGGGSTIMSYTNLCGPHNVLQSFSDPMFNQGAYGEITSYIAAGGNCSANTSTGNTPPTVNGGADRTVPVGTPFAISATSSDPNGDSLTFSWEERDLGAAQPATGPGSADNGASPIFRAFAPTTSPARQFPQAGALVSNVPAIGEQIPSVARTLHLRVTARDNRAGGGGVNSDDVNLTVTTAAGPFRVTSPDTNVAWYGTHTVTWDVAGTTAAPVSCANVKISLSSDRGFSFPTVLLESTPNTGSAQVTLPNTPTTQARIKVEAIGSIFFDISNVDFEITGVQVPTNVHGTPSSFCEGTSSTLSGTVPAGQTIDWFTGACGASPIGTGTSITVSPAGSTIYYARARVIATGEVGANCAATYLTVSPMVTVDTQPDNQSVHVGGTATFTVSSIYAQSYQWRRNSVNLSDGPSLTGSDGPTLTIAPAQLSDAGAYDVIVTNGCGSLTSSPATLTVSQSCGSADFNGDGDIGTDADIEAFFACLAGTCCPTCGSADFNGDGDIGTDADIESFFRVLGGGTC
jgi:hypothetical protein